MRGVLFLVGAICALGVVDGQYAQTAEPFSDNQLVGTWKLVSVRHGMEGTVGCPDLFSYTDKQTLKHVTPTHTVTVSYFKNGALFMLSGGTCTLDAAWYTETVEYGVDAFKRPLEVKGKRAFDVIVSGTSLHLTMRYGDKGRREELWERFEGNAHDAAKPAATRPEENTVADFPATEVETPDHTKAKQTEPEDGDNE
jgi:hypothetical protein